MAKSQSAPGFLSSFYFLIRLWGILKESILSWPQWWTDLTASQKYSPAILIFGYWGTLKLLSGFRQDHLIIGMCLLVLSYMGRAGRSFLKFSLPFFLTGIVYDSQRFYEDYIRGPIHVSEPYHFDKFFFGIHTPQGILTPNEWWQLHTHPLLDLVTGFSYLVFFSVFILISAYFVFYLSSKGTPKISAKKLATQAYRMPWAFFWLNVIGYSTYYWYAAAPPWYVALYGLGPARLDIPANSAGCARFDQMLGTHFFTEMYGRAADVFGAVPSLHVAYPLLAVYFAFRFGSLQIFCICFYLVMWFSAIYLNHHYMLDILWGSSYALIIGWSVNRFYEWRESSHLPPPSSPRKKKPSRR